MSLPVFSKGMVLVDKDGRASAQFYDFLRRLTDAVDAADASLQTQITDLARAVRALSFPSGAAISGTDAGSNATVTVSAHTRLYGSTSVAVNGGSVTGLGYATRQFIYYDDPTDAGGAVSYAATTTQADALTSDTNPNRHFVATIITPAAAAPPTTGSPSSGSGGVQVV